MAERYLADLRRAASRLPRTERTERVAEIEAHVDTGLAAADNEADVRNLLDGLGDPDDIVASARPPAEDPGSGGRVAMVVGLVGVVLAFVPFFGIVLGVPLGITAIVLGVRARRAARSHGRTDSSATVGVVSGRVAVVLPVLWVLIPMGAWAGYDGVVVEDDVPTQVEPAPMQDGSQPPSD
jgi:lysylphosphatidylglycerol synthetase-like protein (DUF2156 family)